MIVGVRTEIDSVLSVVAPLGLAAAAPEGPVLVVDLDPSGPAYPGPRSLAELVEEGPRRADLTPPSLSSGPRVAILRNGGVRSDRVIEVVEALAQGWPRLVMRIAGDAPPSPWPVVPVIPLLPGILSPTTSRGAVWQATRMTDVAPGPGPLLPPLSRSSLTALLRVRWQPSNRWVSAWRPVWGLAWD